MLEARLLELSGQQHKAERSKLNREVRALQERLMAMAARLQQLEAKLLP